MRSLANRCVVLFCIGSALVGASASGDSGEAELRTRDQGAVVGAGIGTSLVGDDLMVTLGAESLGLRSFGDHRWLLQWEALLALRGGYLANEHPFLPLAGGVARANGELGYRFAPARLWSGYLGARIDGELQAMASPGLSPSALNTINNSDGFGGITALGTVRIDGGASYLTAWRSLLLVAFIQEALRAPEIDAPGAAFLEGGLAARFDVAARLTAWVDAFWGKTPAAAHVALGFTDQTTHQEVDAGFRETFRNRLWLEAFVSLSQDTDHIVYGQSGTIYDTATAPTFSLTIALGIPFGSQQ
jgi:hypothetical protein